MTHQLWQFSLGKTRAAEDMKHLLRTISPLALALGLAGALVSAGWAADMVKLGPGNAYLAAATADDDARGPKLRHESFDQGTEIQFSIRIGLE